MRLLNNAARPFKRAAMDGWLYGTITSASMLSERGLEWQPQHQHQTFAPEFDQQPSLSVVEWEAIP